jgi:hypothetical protein
MLMLTPEESWRFVHCMMYAAARPLAYFDTGWVKLGPMCLNRILIIPTKVHDQEGTVLSYLLEPDPGP